MAGPPKLEQAVVQYAYMFEKDKSPTKQLDALLRAIAVYIVRIPSLACSLTHSLLPELNELNLMLTTTPSSSQMLKIGDRNDKQLTPKKLAAFYKAVGGDYDCRFSTV